MRVDFNGGLFGKLLLIIKVFKSINWFIKLVNKLFISIDRKEMSIYVFLIGLFFGVILISKCINGWRINIIVRSKVIMFNMFKFVFNNFD